MAIVSVIGSGFSGLSAACFAAAAGNKVTVVDQLLQPGGRARMLDAGNFRFDMGPSWYWMPDVFDQFFASFGKKVSDYYELKQLDPGFQVIFEGNEVLPVPADQDALYQVFEQIEPGSAAQLQRFLREAAFKYDTAMGQMIYMPAYSWLEYAKPSLLKGALQSHMFRSVRSYVRRFFKDPRLVALLEFPVLFLGAMPDRIPALYTLMNHAALTQGTFYPMGGMYKVVEGMEDLAQSLGVQFRMGESVKQIRVKDGRVSGLYTSRGNIPADAVIATGDYQHTEQSLLEAPYRNYPATYWEQRTFAPSSLIFYLGVSKKLPKLQHHNLFFDTDFERHAGAIYNTPGWPEQPLFYVCCPSKTDPSVAPEGMENLFILVPVAAGLNDTEEIRDSYFPGLIKRIEDFCGTSFADDIIFRKSYCIRNFKEDYNAYKGNAYGLANTLRQTAAGKPSLRNRKVRNLFYAGQLTVPGPGVPPALISGQIAANELMKQLKQRRHEAAL